MKLKVNPVNRKNQDKIKQIYMNSFSKDDRMPYVMMRIMAKLWRTKLLSFYDGDTLCGFIYMAVTKKLVFVMFFAVDECLRDKGYGSRILKETESLYPNKKIIITIERCDANAQNIDERIRRKNFYIKNGYTETGYAVKMGKEQEIIIKNGEFNKREFILFFMRYSNLTVIPKVWKMSS